MSRISILQELVPAFRRGNWAPATLRKHLFGNGDRSIEELCQLMMKSDGEYSSLLIGDQILNAFEQLDDQGCIDFFHKLNEDYDLDVAHLQDMARVYAEKQDVNALKQLTIAAESKRKELFRRINMAPQGTKTLGENARVSATAREKKKRRLGKWTPIFVICLVPGSTAVFFLCSLSTGPRRRISLRKLSPMKRSMKFVTGMSYADASNRKIDTVMRFFTPPWRMNPLVFVEVALTDKIPEKIDSILTTERQHIEPEDASCALFYSISNCHTGLSGVSFGNLLIKQVATSLAQRFPHLKTFSTISPVPGFSQWLQQTTEQETDIARFLEESAGSKETLQAFLSESDNRESFMRLAARYFHEPKNHREEPIDPVARFHLKNGAKLERLNVLGDLSEKAFTQSLGLMVNYVYDLSKVEENHENYMKNKQIICSPLIKKLSNKRSAVARPSCRPPITSPENAPLSFYMSNFLVDHLLGSRQSGSRQGGPRQGSDQPFLTLESDQGVGATIRYGVFRERVNQIANLLIDSGLQQGDRVMVQNR